MKYSNAVSCLFKEVEVMVRAKRLLMFCNLISSAKLDPSGVSCIPSVLWCLLVNVGVIGIGCCVWLSTMVIGVVSGLDDIVINPRWSVVQRIW